MVPRSSSPHFDSRVAPGRTRFPHCYSVYFYPPFVSAAAPFFLLILRMREILESVPKLGVILIQHVLQLTLLKLWKDGKVTAAGSGQPPVIDDPSAELPRTWRRSESARRERLARSRGHPSVPRDKRTPADGQIR